MKNTLFICLFSLLYFNSFSQEMYYNVHGKYILPVNKEKLIDAKLLADFIDGYPHSWVSDYISTEIETSSQGNSLIAKSQNDILSNDQQNILSKVELGTDVKINVNYKYKNSVTEIVENRQMYVKMTVIPEIEAEFVGGDKQLKKYLKQNEISEKFSDKFQGGIVLFTINENGEILNPQITKTSGDPETDKLLIEIINNMPKWKPAQNGKGIKVKQDFVLSVGMAGC